jgi:hypothetical protein
MTKEDEINKMAWKGYTKFVETPNKRQFLTGSSAQTKDIPDQESVGMCTSPLRWIQILVLLPDALRRKVERHLSPPVHILEGTSVIQEVVLDARFTRKEKAIIRDAYCAIVPGVIQVPVDDAEGGDASENT